MNATATQVAGLSPPTADCLWNLLGITATWSMGGLLAPEPLATHPSGYLLVFLAAVGAYLLHHVACLSRPPRVRSLRGLLWSPFGRIRAFPEGMPVLSAKRYYFHESETYTPMRAWVGWWNCRTFTSDPAADEYFFIDRRTRFALRADEILSAR